MKRGCVAIVGFVLLLSTMAGACECATGGLPPCEFAGWDDITHIFVGSVTAIGKNRPDARGMTSTATLIPIQFNVSEDLRGKTAAVFIVYTPAGDPSCGYPFKRGETYLVYASRGRGKDKKLHVSICSRTRLLRFAEEDLAFLRASAIRPQPTRIFGSVKRHLYDPNFKRQPYTVLAKFYDPPEELYRSIAPMAGQRVTATGENGEKLTAMTDEKGRYEFANVVPGKYVVKTEFPQELLPFKPRETTIRAGYCGQVEIRTELDGRIQGFLLFADGSLGYHVPLAVKRLDPVTEEDLAIHYQNMSDSRINIGPLQPGKYVLWAEELGGKTYFPSGTDESAAQVFVVGPGEKVGEIHFRLRSGPPLKRN